jgi:hypothetical protein
MISKYIIQCVSPEGITLTTYGGYFLPYNTEFDLLASDTNDSIRANDYVTARTMCEDTGFEIAQRIIDGTIIIVSALEIEDQI